MSEDNRKLKLGALTALVVGSMIGGGIFSIPQNMASGAEAGAILIDWGITAIGMLMFAFVFRHWSTASLIWTMVCMPTPKRASAIIWGFLLPGVIGSAPGSAT